MFCRAALIAVFGLAVVSSASKLGVQRFETKAVAALRRAAAIDFGTCSNPEIQDINGVFSPVNTKDFGSVAASTNLDDVVIGVCNVLATKCGVDGITNGDCSTAASDAIGVGNTAAADDEFNSVLGITSDFASTAAAVVAAASAPGATVETIVTTIVSTIITTIDAAATAPAASATFTGAAAATNVAKVKASSSAKAASSPAKATPAKETPKGTKGKPARL